MNSAQKLCIPWLSDSNYDQPATKHLKRLLSSCICSEFPEAAVSQWKQIQTVWLCAAFCSQLQSRWMGDTSVIFFFPTGRTLWRPHMHRCNYIIAGQQQDRKLWLMNDSRLPPVNAVLLKKGCRTVCRIVWKIFSRRFYFHRNLPFSPLFPHIPDKIYATNVYTSLYLTLAQNTMTVKGGWYQAYHNNAFRLHCLYI